MLIEPVPEFAEACRKNHEAHPQVSVLQKAIGEEPSGFIELHVAGVLTTANHQLEAEYEATGALKGESAATTLVPCSTLDKVLEDTKLPTGFDVLVVDVEGFESNVFNGFNLELYRPKLMIVEIADTHPDLVSTRSSDAKLTLNILRSGYAIVFKDRINTVFVREDVWRTALFSQD